MRYTYNIKPVDQSISIKVHRKKFTVLFIPETPINAIEQIIKQDTAVVQRF